MLDLVYSVLLAFCPMAKFSPFRGFDFKLLVGFAHFFVTACKTMVWHMLVFELDVIVAYLPFCYRSLLGDY